MKFIFRITPVPQGRPRFTVMGKHVKAYDPAKSKKYKMQLKKTAWRIMIHNIWQRIDNAPISMNLIFVLPRPKRPKNKDYHITKPDLDNLVKAVKDALNGIAYADDSQITELKATKRYCQDVEPPGVIVNIEEIRP